MKEFCGPRAKTYTLEDSSEHKKAKGTKKVYNKTRAYV